MKHYSKFLEHKVIPVEELLNYHKDVEDIAKMADAPWKVSPSQFHGISENRLLDILSNSPISCIKVRSKLHVIGGFRSWNLVMSYFRKNKKPINIPVQIIRRKMNTKQRREFAASSLLLPLMSHALGQHGHEYIGHLWASLEEVAPDCYKHFFSARKSTKSRLPRDLGQSYESFYPKDKSNEK